MRLPFQGKSRSQELIEVQAKVHEMEAEAKGLSEEVHDLLELVAHLDRDRALLHEAARRLRPGVAPTQLATTLLDLSFRAFDLASFYVAVVDRDLDLLSFLLYHEGGRTRNHPSRRLSEMPGLTGKALQEGAPLYTRTTEEAEALGAVFTEAEKGSGLVPASWYGVPLGYPDRPSGLVSFQSFQKDAFSLSQRQTMDTLAAMLGLALCCSEFPLDQRQ